MKCLDCRWFQHNNPGGECHLHPPVRLPRRFDPAASSGNRVRSEELIWGWPEVLADDWCGCYVQRPL